MQDVDTSSLAELRAGPTQRKLIVAAFSGIVVASALVVPFATHRLAAAPAAAGLFATVVAMADLLTFLLLAANAATSGSRALGLLALAYLYDCAMALLHIATFPGALVPDVRLIGSPDAVGWLFVLWRVGFPVLVLAVVLVAALDRASLDEKQFPRQFAAGIAATLAAVAAMYVFVRYADLPPYFQGNRFAGWPLTASWIAAALCVVTLLAIHASGLGERLIFLLLSLVLVANAMGLAIPNFGGERYTVGWYVGRMAVIVSSTLVLGLLLLQVVRTHRSLAWSVSRLARQTESLQAEMHRRTTAERRLSQAQKMEAVGQLAGGIAHDFNNLLQVIGMRIDALRRRGSSASIDEDAHVIQRTVRRAESLTRQLLSFAGRRSYEPRRLCLDEWLPRFLDLARTMLRRDVKVSTDIAPDAWDIEVDPGELELALMNLVSNARDAMPDGGTLRVDVRNRPGPPDETTRNPGGEFVVPSVSDSGSGIEPGVLEHVFEPFFTTKEGPRGSGLGLSQVYGFATRSGGRVGIESEPGKGTTVTLCLPRAGAAPEPRRQGNAEPAPASSLERGSLVLVVDDDDDVAMATCALLQEIGFAVCRARSGREALERVTRGDFRPRLVLADIVMPGEIDGIELAHRLRSIAPDLAVVLCTGYSAAAERSAAAGFVILRKPYDAEALERAAASVLARVSRNASVASDAR